MLTLCDATRHWQIRAENLSGDCRFGREFTRRNWNFTKQHQVRSTLFTTPLRSELTFGPFAFAGVRAPARDPVGRGKPELQVQGGGRAGGQRGVGELLA